MLAASTQLWCWHRLIQPHRGPYSCCNPPLALQEAQVSFIHTQLPPTSTSQPALSLANSSGRLEQGETWHCHQKNLPEWGPNTAGPSWNQPSFNRFSLFNRLLLPGGFGLRYWTCSASPKISPSALLHSLAMLEILNPFHSIQKSSSYALEPYLQLSHKCM